MHKKVKNIVRRTNPVFAENPGNLRNGCLIFWKLAQPTLPDGLVRLLTFSRKLFVNRTLARRAADLRSTCRLKAAKTAVRKGNDHRALGTISPHEPVIKSETGTGISCFAKTLLP